jgi:hypothetical protein
LPPKKRGGRPPGTSKEGTSKVRSNDPHPNWSGVHSFPPRVGKAAPNRWAAAWDDRYATRVREVVTELKEIEAKWGKPPTFRHYYLDLSKVTIYGRPQMRYGTRYDRQGRYIAPKKGRPRNPNKLSNAEKQRRYRQRKKSK